MPSVTPPSLSTRGIVSYAQNFEDVMLWRALKQVKEGFYIDVGAQSPDSDSVTKAFSLAGWRGINVEPHPAFYDQLRDSRPNDTNLNVALGEQQGSVTMSLVENTGLSTADMDIAAQHEAAGYELHKHTVPLVTLNEVWHEHVSPGQSVHFLKVDVEGFERAVLAGNNWKRNRPWVVLVEATLPNSQVECHENWEPILLDADYLFVYADGLNRFYVAKEHDGLASSFKYPPNVFDGFTTALEQALRERADTLHDDLVAAHVAQRAAAEDAANLREQVLVLDRGLREANRLADQAQARAEEANRLADLAQAHAEDAMHREMALRAQLDTETAQLESEIADHVDAEQRADLAQKRAEAAELRYQTIVQSPWWRVTGPARRLVTIIPPSVRQKFRRLL